MKIFIATVFAICAAFAMAAQSATIYYDNGAAIVVPESSYELQVNPKGFNSFPYSVTNPKGKAPGWAGWPEYDSGCNDGLTLGGVCEPQPYILAWPNIDEPTPTPPTCAKPGELVVGPSVPCED